MSNVDKPSKRPLNSNFSSGPCAKRPGWTPDVLADALLGRSHRSAPGKKRIQEVAKKLISIAAKRLESHSYKINFNPSDYDKFSSTFPYVETDDQLSAIEDVIDDFKKVNPSDRLIVGDVAFGKTEVIIRALYLAVKSNLQCIAFLLLLHFSILQLTLCTYQC